MMTPPEPLQREAPTDLAEASRLRELADQFFEAECAETVDRPLRRPTSTYRLQLHKGFRFDDVTAILDYLRELGISDVYLSPFMSAKPGSTHGYDVFDHREINSEVGDVESHRRLVGELESRGMGRVLDIVPNHMGISGLNPFWMDVLELGKQSSSARFFDIDWNPVKQDLQNRLLLPILEAEYAHVLESGLLKLVYVEGKLFVQYHERVFPVDPRSYATVLSAKLDEMPVVIETDDVHRQEYLSIINSAGSLPGRDSMERADLDRLEIERHVIPQRLKRVLDESPRLYEHFHQALATFNCTPGDPTQFDPLHRLLDEQNYRLAYWRVGAEEVNYRRFFDISDLAGIRMEDPSVFDDTHKSFFDWIELGGVAALRIDHPDGLADPVGYFRRLQLSTFLRACQTRWVAAGSEGDWGVISARILERFNEAIAGEGGPALARRFPVIAEKILSGDEPLPDEWPIDGTVGYEYLNALNGLFVDPAAAESMEATYRLYTGDATPFPQVLAEAKRLIILSSLSSEKTMLARSLERVAMSDRHSRDFTLADLSKALYAVMEAFPVYRTYVRPDEPISDLDRAVIEEAIGKASEASKGLEPKLFDFFRKLLFREVPEVDTAEARAYREEFVRRFQQLTGPVQAKGLEDTTFYRYVPLLSLNEVGGDPSHFGVSPGAFHARNADRLARWPHNFSATATHDTKRGEDARARLNLLSENPEGWSSSLMEWASLNAGLKPKVGEVGLAPDAREEMLLYQSLIATWPLDQGPDDVPPVFVSRMQEYLVKAAREAKLKTSWTDPSPRYAEALREFVEAILTRDSSKPFRDSLVAFIRPMARLGLINSLAQTVLKVASPGVADVYQGCEIWDFSLVDPDNRRPVDYNHRTELLRTLEGGGGDAAERASRLFANPDDGAIKLLLLSRTLRHRRDNPALYHRGDYVTLGAEGPSSEHLVAIERRHDGKSVLAVVPRLVGGLMGWEGFDMDRWRSLLSGHSLKLDPASPRLWRDLLTGRTFKADPAGALDPAELLSTLPVAYLVSEG